MVLDEIPDRTHGATLQTEGRDASGFQKEREKDTERSWARRPMYGLGNHVIPHKSSLELDFLGSHANKSM
jgi:hypothetical protein